MPKFQKIDTDYEVNTKRVDISSVPKCEPASFNFPSKDDFKFPSAPSDNTEWALIGYITSQSNVIHTAYKLYERYNKNEYVYEYLALVENKVYVQLPSFDRKIRHSHVLPDGSVPGKEGLGSFKVYRYSIPHNFKNDEWN